jgi:hypothetical protein
LAELLLGGVRESKKQSMKTLRNITCIVALATLFSGCVTQHQMTTPFDESEFQSFVGKGTATITGQAFLKTVGGEVRYGAGDPVILTPVTPYTTEALLAERSLRLPQTDPRLLKYLHTVIADGSGNFEFQDIPPGDYYIKCAIVWVVPDQNGIIEQTGGVAYAETHIGDGETVKVVVTSQ